MSTRNPDSRLRHQGKQKPTGRRVNLYVTAEDQAVWDRAGRFADERRVSLSSLAAEALDAYLREQAKEK